MQSIRSRSRSGDATRRFRFAPLSEEPSGRLRLASGYFLLTGGFAALATLAMLVVALGGSAGAGPSWGLALGITLNLLFAGANLWAGRQLAERSRSGGRIALGLLLLPLLGAAVGSSPSALTLVLTAVGVAVIVSVWEELE